MTDLLTKEERETVERIRARRTANGDQFEEYEDIEGTKDFERLFAIIDNLSKRGVKKYSEEELQELCHKRLDERTFGNDHLKWRSFEIYLDGWVEFARFLGVLEEK